MGKNNKNMDAHPRDGICIFTSVYLQDFFIAKSEDAQLVEELTMCCYSNRRDTDELLQAFGNRKTILLWKEISQGGSGIFSGYEYSPGIHKMKVPFKRYNADRHKGFHVHTRKPNPDFICYGDVLIRVVCHRDHLVRAGGGQAVFTQILILEADWHRAFGYDLATTTPNT